MWNYQRYPSSIDKANYHLLYNNSILCKNLGNKTDYNQIITRSAMQQKIAVSINFTGIYQGPVFPSYC